MKWHRTLRNKNTKRVIVTFLAVLSLYLQDMWNVRVNVAFSEHWCRDPDGLGADLYR